MSLPWRFTSSSVGLSVVFFNADRRSSTDFTEGFAAKFRPLVMTQEVKLLHAAPWGPHP